MESVGRLLPMLCPVARSAPTMKTTGGLIMFGSSIDSKSAGWSRIWRITGLSWKPLPT